MTSPPPTTTETNTAKTRKPIFYGWWMVSACLVVAIVGWALGVFGIGVYIHALTTERGFSISLVSIAITAGQLVHAASLMTVGSSTARHGPRPVIAAGGLLMAATAIALAWTTQAWQVFGAFILLGLGRACLSTTSISNTLAPWFERHQGRVVSLALMGASVAGMIGTPLLMLGIASQGFSHTMLMAAAFSLLSLLPLAFFVLRHRPQDMGLLPDGEPPLIATLGATALAPVRKWSRTEAMATRQFRTVVIGFGLALMVQSGFLVHHVTMVFPVLGAGGAALAVSAAAMSAFLGRVALARYADRVDVRLVSGGVLLLSTFSLSALALLPTQAGLLAASIAYGLTIGNVTTLPPIVMRREFGAASFGAVFGASASMTQVFNAFGPGLFGVLRDWFGSYAPGLLLAAVLNLLAAGLVVWGGRKPLGDRVETAAINPD